MFCMLTNIPGNYKGLFDKNVFKPLGFPYVSEQAEA